MLTFFVTGFLSLCNSASKPANLRGENPDVSLLRGGFGHWKRGTVGAGPLWVDPASVQADARNGQCSWPALALCSTTATGIPHLNSLLPSLLYFSNTARLALGHKAFL